MYYLREKATKYYVNIIEKLKFCSMSNEGLTNNLTKWLAGWPLEQVTDLTNEEVNQLASWITQLQNKKLTN